MPGLLLVDGIGVEMGVRGCQIVGDIFGDACFECGHWRGVPGFAESGEVCTGVVLVFVAKGLWHRNVFYALIAVHGCKGGGDEVFEGSCGAVADVEEAGNRVFEQPGDDGGAVAYIDKVAELFAVGVVGPVGTEESDASFFADL